MDDDELKRIFERFLDKLTSAADSYLDGSSGWDRFKARVFRLMRQIYYESGSVPADGELTSEQRDIIERALAEQLYPGGAGDFALTDKLDEFRDGGISWAQLFVSLTMYFKSARSVAYEVYQDSRGERLVERRLGATDQHCPECLLLASLAPVKLADAVIPGRECRCYTNCLCRLVEVGGDN